MFPRFDPNKLKTPACRLLYQWDDIKAQKQKPQHIDRDTSKQMQRAMPAHAEAYNAALFRYRK